jgi:ribonuclease HI
MIAFLRDIMKQVSISCDGACKGNPGPGGWGALLVYGEHEKRIYGHVPHTTNNRMEIIAAIESLKALNVSCEVTIFSDSQYLVKGMSQWIHGWKKKNWHNVKNVDLWQALDEESQRHSVTWQWVRGHWGDYGNEEADRLANYAISIMNR